MAETGIQKAFESPGVFWLPEKPDQPISGQLSHTSEAGPRVNLVGSFGTSILPRNFPIVHGVLDNSPCTLFNCRQISSKSSYGGLQQITLEADVLLVGEHIASLDEPIFTGAKVRFGGLDEWVNFSAIKIGAWQDDRVNTPSRFDIVIQPPITSKVEAIGGLVTLAGSQSGSFGHLKIDWEHHSFLDVLFDKPTSIRDLFKSTFELQHLFALLTWTSAPVSYFSVLRVITADAMNPSGKRWSGFYGHWTMTPRDYKTSSHLLTYLADVYDALPQIIASWFQSSAAVKHPEIYLQVSFAVRDNIYSLSFWP
jgi:hypothetical protein